MKEAIILLFLAIACYTDWKSKQIKNELLLCMLVFGLCDGYLRLQIQGVISSLFGLFLCISIVFPLYWLRMFGAGDIKLLGCVAAIVGWKIGLIMMLSSFLAGGVIASIILLYQNNVKQRWKTLHQYVYLVYLTKTLPAYEDVRNHSSVFRFSFAIFLGVCAVFILQ